MLDRVVLDTGVIFAIYFTDAHRAEPKGLQWRMIQSGRFGIRDLRGGRDDVL